MRGKTPLGHFISAHHVHGWCSLCPGHSVIEELAAWRVWATTLPDIAAEIRRQQPGGHEPDTTHTPGPT